MRVLALYSIAGCLLGGPESARAQIQGRFSYDAKRHAYFISGDTTISGDVTVNPATGKPFPTGPGNDVFVGKNNAKSFTTISAQHPVTLTLTGSPDGRSGAKTISDGTGNPYRDGSYLGIAVFGNHCVQMRGGNVDGLRARDNARVEISAGKVGTLTGRGKSRLQIRGGAISSLNGSDSAAIHVQNSRLHNVQLTDKSRLHTRNANIARFLVWNDAEVTLLTGHITHLEGAFSSTLHLRGGNVDKLMLIHDSNAELHGCQVKRIEVDNRSRLEWNSGTVQEIQGHQQSVIHMRGGNLAGTVIRLKTGSVAHFYANKLKLLPTTAGRDQTGPYNDYLVTGLFADGQSINGVTIRDYKGGFEITNRSFPNGEQSPLQFHALPDPVKTRLGSILMLLCAVLLTLPAIIAFVIYTGIGNRLQRKSRR